MYFVREGNTRSAPASVPKISTNPNCFDTNIQRSFNIALQVAFPALGGVVAIINCAIISVWVEDGWQFDFG